MVTLLALGVIHVGGRVFYGYEEREWEGHAIRKMHYDLLFMPWHNGSISAQVN